MSQSGYIQAITPRETRVGIMYDLVIDGQKIGAGKFKPKGVDVGDYVNYDVDMNGKFRNLKAGSLSKATPPAGVSKPAQSTGTGYSTPYVDRQEIISKQSALNSALAFVEILNTAGALPIPASKKAAEKADLIEQIVMEYTAKFYHMNTGNTFELPDTAAVAGGDLSGAEEADGDWTE